MNKYDEKREERINALLEGKLNEADAETLKTQATDDRELARAIIEAYQLQQAMDAVRVEPAPASLTRRLHAVPREQRNARAPRFLQPRWVMTLAAVPLAIIAVNLMHTPPPSAEQITKARLELAIAFAYLDKAGSITGREIDSTVTHTMADALGGSVNRTIKFSKEHSKEKEV